MLKRLLSLFLLFSLLSQSLFSEYVFTDEAYERLMELQKTSEETTKADGETISGLETTLSHLEDKQERSEEITALDEKLIEKQGTSLKEQRIDSFLASLEIFFWGLVVGLVAGFYSGIKLAYEI